jgi:hypothetical protein
MQQTVPTNEARGGGASGLEPASARGSAHAEALPVYFGSDAPHGEYSSISTRSRSEKAGTGAPEAGGARG